MKLFSISINTAFVQITLCVSDVQMSSFAHVKKQNNEPFTPLTGFACFIHADQRCLKGKKCKKGDAVQTRTEKNRKQHVKRSATTMRLES